MYKKSEFTQIVLNLLTILVVLDIVLPIFCVKDKDIKDVKDKLDNKFNKFVDMIPNEIAGWDLNDHRPFRIAFRVIMMQKRLYRRLTQKYKRKIKFNEQMRKKYRTIVPVSIVPTLIVLARANRWRQAEYYIVGPNESVEPKHIYLPGEPPKDPVALSAMQYKH